MGVALNHPDHHPKKGVSPHNLKHHQNQFRFYIMLYIHNNITVIYLHHLMLQTSKKTSKNTQRFFSSNASPPGDRGRPAHRGNLSALVLRYPLPGKATKSHWANGHLWFLYDYGLVIFHIVMGVRLPKGSHLMWKLVVTSKCLCRLWRMIGKMRCDSLLFRLATRQISTDLDLVWSKSFFKEMPRVTESHPRKDQKPSCPMLYSWCPFWISQIKP